MLLDIITDSTTPAALSLVSLLSASAVSWATASVNTEDFSNYLPDFHEWKKAWNVTYPNADVERARAGIWIDNKRRVDEHETHKRPWTLSLNPFADQTPAEFQGMRNGLSQAVYPRPPTHYPPLTVNPHLPTSVDWRDHGIVNPIKDQAQCGSCWAFSAIASLEGQYARLTKNLTSFSEQDLVDCVQNVQVASGGDCCDGCEGGLMDAAFDYLITAQNGQDDLESKYAYTAMDGTCAFKVNGPGLADVTGRVDLPMGCDHALQTAVAHVGVVSVGVDANDDWQMYTGGVYVPDPDNGGCSSDPGALDHGVAVVGYNTDVFPDGSGQNKTMNYWIIRNSWGTSWGNDGYMYLSRDVPNACGLSNYASYPVLSSKNVQENQCLNAHPQCPQEVCYTACPCDCFVASSTSPCDCSAATCAC